MVRLAAREAYAREAYPLYVKLRAALHSCVVSV